MYPPRSYSLRKQQRNPMLMAKELPEDLVTQILLWLPVVSLLRFKCVCKSWYALITHQNFITKHLYNKNNKNNNTLLLLKMFDKTTKSYVVSTLSYETLQVSLTQPLPPPSFWVNKKGHISIVGSCNGLVCLHDEHGENVVIWNPATKETKVVPKSNMPHFPACHDSRIYGTGFGFDAKTNDYKIINLISLCESNSINGEKIVLSEIYSLSADSWRKVDSPLYFDIYDRHSFCYISYNLSLNGMFSWRIWAGNWDGVLSFDMSNEVFIKTLLPDGVIAASFQDLFVLKESIAMVEECSEITRFQIWLLLEVGVKDSWTKLITVGPFTGIERNLGFWNNETMLLEKHDRQLVLYEPSTKEMIDLPIHYAGRHSFPLVTFMETLVSVKGGNEFEDEQNSC